MEAFKKVSSRVVPLDRSNVDTDAIIPKQFLKSIHRTGFAPYLFDEWRYLDRGEPGMDCSNRPLNKEFVLNQPRYEGAQILLTRRNFGCGSSREHAPWALADYGFRVLIAPSFADIFYNNCFKNGLLPIILDETVVDRLFQTLNLEDQWQVDLQGQTITLPGEDVLSFSIDEARKFRLLNGLDDIGLTLECADEIRDYEEQRKKRAPWLFSGISV